MIKNRIAETEIAMGTFMYIKYDVADMLKKYNLSQEQIKQLEDKIKKEYGLPANFCIL